MSPPDPITFRPVFVAPSRLSAKRVSFIDTRTYAEKDGRRPRAVMSHKMRLTEAPIRPKAPGAAPAAKRRSVRRAEQANARAAMRAMVARFLSAQLDEDATLSVNDLLIRYKAARKAGDPRLTDAPAYSRASLARVLARVQELRAADEPIGSEQFRDKWGHRPVREEDSIVRDFALETLVLRPRSSIPEIFEEVKAFAEERGYPVIPASTLASMRGGLDRQGMSRG